MKHHAVAAHLAAIILAGLASTTAHAQVTVADPWVRGTVAGQQATGAFMQLKSAADTALVSASSPVAGVVEIHEMKMDGGVMKMSAIKSLAVPAGKAVELKPGGYHVMLMDLKQPLKEGETVPVTLNFEDKSGRKQAVEVKATVKALTAPAKDPAHKH
jgi:copper(I)-binding protein